MSSIYGASGLKGATGGAAGNMIPKGTQLAQIQQFTPEQMNLFRSLFSHLMPGSSLSNLAGGDEAAFEQIEGPALKQFSGLQGNIASRFSGMGGLGARRSSGFQNTMNQAASDFAERLASQRHGLQRQALMDLLNMSTSILSQKPTERFLTHEEPSFWEKILGGGGGLLGSFAGNFGGGLGNLSSKLLGGLFS